MNKALSSRFPVKGAGAGLQNPFLRRLAREVKDSGWIGIAMDQLPEASEAASNGSSSAAQSWRGNKMPHLRVRMP
jgi:hypothetical protein